MEILMVGGMIARTLRHGMLPQIIDDEPSRDRIRSLTEQYRMALKARPFANRIQLALTLGTRIFDVDTAMLRGPKRKYSEARQQLMTFVYVASEDGHNFKAIGRAFNRHHATVMHAVRKYETAMKELVA